MENKIEYRDWGRLYLNGNPLPLTISIHSSDFGRIIEKIDKRLYEHWADGVTIFHFTEKQFCKFNSLIRKYQ
jgi:hypothetical protein